TERAVYHRCTESNDPDQQRKQCHPEQHSKIQTSVAVARRISGIISSPQGIRPPLSAGCFSLLYINGQAIPPALRLQNVRILSTFLAQIRQKRQKKKAVPQKGTAFCIGFFGTYLRLNQAARPG